MKIKLDENITTQVAPVLSNLGHDVHTVSSEGLVGRPDEDVWLAAQAEHRFLITQDFGFADIRRFSPGTHWGIMLLRLRVTNQAAIAERLSDAFLREDTSIWSRCLVILTETKIRVIQEA